MDRCEPTCDDVRSGDASQCQGTVVQENCGCKAGFVRMNNMCVPQEECYVCRINGTVRVNATYQEVGVNQNNCVGAQPSLGDNQCRFGIT